MMPSIFTAKNQPDLPKNICSHSINRFRTNISTNLRQTLMIPKSNCLDLYEVIFCKMQSVPDELQSVDNPAEMPCIDGQSVKICKTNPVVEVIVDISHFLLAINSSANVIIYALRGNELIYNYKSQKSNQLTSICVLGIRTEGIETIRKP